jgi:shikimate dehydrogenase
MKNKLAVLGLDGIEKYSLSPLIHSHFLSTTGIEGEYVAIPVLPDNLHGKLKELQENGYVGVNLTIPHKVNSMKYLDFFHKTANVVGAVNTVLFVNNSMVGFNTDCSGFIKNLDKKVPKWEINNNKIIVMGAGGTSRAIICGLKNKGVSNDDITICNRTYSKALELANEFGCGAVEMENVQNILKNKNLLINATSVGMNNSGSLNIDLDSMQKNSVICDIVYTPLATPLLKQAKMENFKTVDGLGMLLYQAAEAFEIWFKVSPIVSDELLNKCLKVLQFRE